MIDISHSLFFIGLIAILLELFIGVDTGFDLLIIGLSLIMGGIVGIFSHHQEAAIITTAFLSFLYILIGRNMIRHRLFIKSPKTNIENVIGEIGIVQKKITKDHAGQVKIKSET